MRTAAFVAALLVAGVARAQTPPASGATTPEPAPATEPATEKPAEKPAAQTPPASGATTPEPAPATTEKAAAEKPAAEKPSPKKGGGFTVQYGSLSATLYGLLDVTISTIDNRAGGAYPGRRVTNFQTGWFSGSRWGIQGRNALSPDLGVIFKLEGEYEIPTGAEDTAGVIFNRDCWVGVDGAFGKLTFGRQNTVARDFSQNYGDPYGTAFTTLDEGGWTNTNNFKQLIFFAGSVTGTRYDRGIVWKKAFGPVVAGLGYQFGSGVSGSPFAQETTRSAALAYNGGIFNLSGFYTWAGRASATGATLGHNAYAIGGNVLPIPLIHVNAGYFHYQAQQAGGLDDRKDDGFTVSAKVRPDGPFDVEVGYQLLKTKNAGVPASGNVPNPFAAVTPTATATGDKTTIYGSVFYHLDARAEVYLAADYMKLKDGYHVAVVTGGADNQTELAVGLRFKF